MLKESDEGEDVVLTRQHVIKEYFFASRLIQTKLPSFLDGKSLKEHIKWITQILAYKTPLDKHFITYTSFIKAIVRVLHCEKKLKNSKDSLADYLNDFFVNRL
jgi:hypothetical protein